MKTFILIFAVLLCSTNLYCQDAIEKEFEAASTLYEEGRYEDSALAFAKFMSDHPTHPLKPRAHFNVAICKLRNADTTNAKTIFKQILDEDYNDLDSNDIMEPYTLYKHHVCRELASIALDQKQFEEAQTYISMFDKKYPYRHFCGNELTAYSIYKDVMLARVYEGTRRPLDAVKQLAPNLFNNGLASNDEAVELMDEILRKNFSPSEVKAMFNDAFSSLSIKKTKYGKEATINFAGVTVDVNRYGIDHKSTESDEEYFKRALRTHTLFLKYL